MTAPSIAYKYVMGCAISSVPTDMIRVCKERSVDAWIREHIHGARCFPRRGYFISSDCSSVREAYEKKNDEDFMRIYTTMTDYLNDDDAHSLYAGAMLEDFPIGYPEWRFDPDIVMESLNKGDESFPLSLIHCRITPYSNTIFPLIPSWNEDRTKIKYTLEPNQEFYGTSIDILQAVKYNKASVTDIFECLTWSHQHPIFRDCMNRLYKRRQKAEEKKNKSLYKAIKIILCSAYGKTGQCYHDSKYVIESDKDVINSLYNNGKVFNDITLRNRQCLLDVFKRNSPVRVPAHINAFILSYSKKIINEHIDAIGGFTDWNTTPYYTDTDSLLVHNREHRKLEQLGRVGENLGQLHDDLDEVDEGTGKIIRAYLIAPKFYIYEICGLKNGKPAIKYHIRCKGVPKHGRVEEDGRVVRGRDDMTIEDFEEMYKNGVPMLFGGNRFAKSFKDTNEPAVKTVNIDRTVNKKTWDGGIWNEENNRWLPICHVDAKKFRREKRKKNNGETKGNILQP